jgi:hypothetical protein
VLKYHSRRSSSELKHSAGGSRASIGGVAGAGEGLADATLIPEVEGGVEGGVESGVEKDGPAAAKVVWVVCTGGFAAGTEK